MNSAKFIEKSHSVITHCYAEFDIRLNLVNAMVGETLENWQRFLRTQKEWMGNIEKVH